MRLISQDGMIGIYDLPYEKCLVYIFGDKKTIKVQPLGEVDSEYVFAKYSTEAKSLKVMEMLSEEYLKYCTARTSEYWFAFNNPKVFKFPKDEEVEV